MNEQLSSRVEVDLAKLGSNVKVLVNLFGAQEVGLMGVTKVVCGSPDLAQVLVDNGIKILADSKLINLKKMRDAGIDAEFVLLRTPSLREIDDVIRYADVNLNTELSVLTRLSASAFRKGIQHRVILMVDMGDLREGILPADLDDFIKEVMLLRGISIVGIGANFACLGGIKPTEEKMNQFSTLAAHIQDDLYIPLTYISGGNSANYNWFMNTDDIGYINNLRLGESIFLGRETLGRKRIPDLFTNVFTFIAEVIESKVKSSLPHGESGQNAFGVSPKFEDRGLIRRVILGVGCQDVLVGGLTPRQEMDILGSSSDHTVLDAKKVCLAVGDQVEFDLNYAALLAAMTSPYVEKKLTNACRPSVASH